MLATRCAVMEDDDEHALAVRQWVNKFIIGLNFCPWAGPAGEAGGLRIVSSTATSAEGVLADLLAEALRLPAADVCVAEGAAEETPLRAATTLLVCPRVEAWRNFEAFNSFYVEELRNGYALAEQNLYIVPFHPRHGEVGPELRDGDRIELGEGPDGVAVFALVLDAAAGYGDQGQPLALVRDDEGDEFHVALPPRPGGEGGAGGAAEAAASRAPRPTLHLLRVADLDRAEDDGVRARNRRRAEAMGPEKLEELLESCG